MIGKRNTPIIGFPTSRLARVVRLTAVGLTLAATSAMAAPVRIDIPAQPLGAP